MRTGAFFSPVMVSSLWCSGKREEKATPGTGASDPDASKLGKKEEERKADSELSSISSPEGSGRAENILTVGRDTTELKDFRGDLAPYPSAEDLIYRDVVAPAKTLSWKSLPGISYALFNILETFWSEAYQMLLTQAVEVSFTPSGHGCNSY